MALYDLADPAVPLPTQMVVDTSFLLALRPGDDNPHAEAARRFVRRMGEQITSYNLVAWLPLPVLQECYHVILANGLRHTWQAMDGTTRPSNWLKMYKDRPELLKTCLPEIERFRQLLVAIPLTLVRPEDLVASTGVDPLEDRFHHFISAYHLLPHDALILSEAERLRVLAVVTLDQDWRRVATFEIYTCLNGT